MLGPRAVTTATLLFNITTLEFENSALRPNGNLLLTTATSSALYEINPLQAAPITATVVASFAGASILGISAIGPDRYAIAGGTPSSSGGPGGYTNSTIWTVDLSANNSAAAPVVAASIPGAQLLDGVAALPASPHVVLVSDALAGVVYRVDTDSGAYSVAVNASAGAFAGNPGVNGLKISEDGTYVYFVNSATGAFGRWAIAADGTAVDGGAEIEIIVAEGAASDDFALAAGEEEGGVVAFLTDQTAPYDVFRVFANGTRESVAQGAGSGRPCSVVLAGDGVTGYFTTAGGQVFRWEVPV